MKAMTRTHAVAGLLSALALSLIACDGDGGGGTYCQDHSDYGYFSVEPKGEGCDDEFTACDSCERGARCRDAIDLTWTNYTSGVCTIPCDSTSDCSAMRLASSFGHTSETWSCTGGWCTVSASRSITPADPCDTCLAACRGLSGCCTGSGCMCEDECN